MPPLPQTMRLLVQPPTARPKACKVLVPDAGTRCPGVTSWKARSLFVALVEMDECAPFLRPWLAAKLARSNTCAKVLRFARVCSFAMLGVRHMVCFSVS